MSGKTNLNPPERLRRKIQSQPCFLPRGSTPWNIGTDTTSAERCCAKGCGSLSSIKRKRWPIRNYSKQTKKWVHKYEKELNPICRPFFKDKLKGEEDPLIQGFFRVATFMSVLYVHSAVPVDAKEKGLTLEYTSFKF